MHKKIEYFLPKPTTEIERREWDSNPRVQGHQLARQFKFHDLEADPF